MSAIEEVLWNVFTAYTLNGNPKDPSRLNGSGLLKFCRDIMALDAVMTEVPLTKAGLDLIYTAEIKSPKKVRSSQAEKSDKLDFDQFLSSLIKIAHKCYPSAKSKDEAMQQLLMDNILPLAARRKPVSIANFLKQPPIEALFKYYEGALFDLFQFYSASSEQTSRGKNMIKATSNVVKTFDDQVGLIEESKVRNQIQSSSSHCIGYADFQRFANDFSMTTSLKITSLDLGDIYLTVLATNSFHPTLRKIDFREFWEAIVRCALVAFQDAHGTTTENKVKSLFHFIWRNTQAKTQDLMLGYGTLGGGGFNTYRGGLLKGTQALNDRFVQAWTKDNYRDYLDPTGVSVLATAADKHKRAVEIAHGIGEKVKVGKSAPAPPPGPPPGASLMQRLLSPKGGAAADGGKSPVKRKGDDRPSSSTSSVWVSDGDNLAPDHVHVNMLHDTVERRENFVVKTADGSEVCVMIRDDDHVGDADGRINTVDLRRLLSVRPDIAVILYDCIVEEGLMDPEQWESQGGSDGEATPAARSRTNSKVAFSQQGLAEDEEGQEKGEGGEGEEADGEEEETDPDFENLEEPEGGGEGGNLSMGDLDEVVDELVEEGEPVPDEE